MPTKRDKIGNVLRQRVISGLHLGILRPGDRLPSARQVAKELGADQRVVVAAYRDLEEDGLVQVRSRSGIRVSPPAARLDTSLPRLARRVVDVLTDELMSGAPAPQFPERVRQCLETVRLRAACIECNADQLAAICGELADDYGLDSHPVDIASLRPGDTPPAAIRRGDLLVTTTYHLTPVRRLARKLQKPVLVVTRSPAYLAHIGHLLKQGLVYFVGTDPRFARKLRIMFQDTPGAENLRPVILGRDDPKDIPADAPALVMPTARGRLADSALARRPVSPPRGFSAETARALLTFIIEANVAALSEAKS